MANRVRNRGEHRVRKMTKPVVHPEPLAPGFHKAGPSQIGEVPGRLRLRDFQALMDVAHAHLTREEQSQNPEPRRISKGLEQGFHRHQLLVHISALTNIARNP